MYAVHRVFASRFLTTGAFIRITSVNNPCFLSSQSDDVKKKTSISSLLKSLKQADSKVDLSLEDVLHREKPLHRKESQENTTQGYVNVSQKLQDVGDAQGTVTKDDNVNISRQHYHSSKRSRDTSDTLAKVYNDSTDLKRPVSQEMNNKLKSILSKLKVDSAKSQLSRDIVGAAKSWGRSGPRYRKDIQQDFEMQSQPEPARASHMVSLTTGTKFELFDDIFKDQLPGKEAVPELKLLEGEDLELLEKHKSLDQRNDFLTLIEFSDKQWKFPVDNEVCKVEEDNVGFEEHVFLGYLLDGFPKKGPVRRFMELVVNGLEQNPFMTVEQKRNQVSWFKEYFENVPEEDLTF